MTPKTALVTGITGQDGSYLAELLLSKGYVVHGIVRRSSTINTSRIDHVFEEVQEESPRLVLHYGDLTDGSRLVTLLTRIAPAEIYHLAAQSHVRVSFDEPEFTGDVTALGTTRILEAMRISQVPARFYQASSSEMFGRTSPPQREDSVFEPRSPYAIAKLHSYWTVRNYREAYGLFASNGILFNHESPRRGETFLTRKVCIGVGRILAGLQTHLYLGNLAARRDWGYAPEYVEAMWRMLQHDVADDFVIATGTSYSVGDFVRMAFEYAGLDWQEHVRFDERYMRPTEVDDLVGDATKAQEHLGWSPKTFTPELVKIMVDAERNRFGA